MKLRYDPVAHYRPYFKISADGDNFDPAQKPTQEKTADNSTSILHSYAYVVVYAFGIIFTVLSALACIASVFVITTWSSDYTNQLLVLTAHRTRDLQEPNAFSMYSVFGDDPSTRLFLCLMDSEIAKDDCPIQNSPVSFRNCLMGKNKDCIASADWNWPIDYGFQRCVLQTFAPPVRKINIFVECMKHTDGILAESVESQNSLRVMGSYNYVSLLLSAAAVIVSFLLFTAGGFYHGNGLVTKEKHGNHIWDWYAPLSGCNIIYAFIWTTACLVGSYLFMFPPAIDAFQKKQGYPTTPWTGIVTVGTFFILMIYYLWLLLEAWLARNSGGSDGTEKSQNFDVPTVKIVPGNVLPAPSAPEYSKQGTSSMTVPRNGDVISNEPYIQDANGKFIPNPYFSSTRFRLPFMNRLGIQLFGGKSSVAGNEVNELIPVLVPKFSTLLIFTDGLIFVGMITPQHSPLQESVFFVFVGVILSRITLMVCYEFIASAFFDSEENKAQQVSVFAYRKDDPKKFALRVISAFTYLASLVLLFIPLYHLMISINYLTSLTNIGSNCSAVTVTFLIFVALMPEIVRSVIIIGMWNGFFTTNEFKLACFQFVFTWEWISRVVFICIGMFALTTHLTDSSNTVINYLKVT